MDSQLAAIAKKLKLSPESGIIDASTLLAARTEPLDAAQAEPIAAGAAKALRSGKDGAVDAAAACCARLGALTSGAALGACCGALAAGARDAAKPGGGDGARRGAVAGLAALLAGAETRGEAWAGAGAAALDACRAVVAAARAKGGDDGARRDAWRAAGGWGAAVAAVGDGAFFADLAAELATELKAADKDRPRAAAAALCACAWLGRSFSGELAAFRSGEDGPAPTPWGPALLAAVAAPLEVLATSKKRKGPAAAEAAPCLYALALLDAHRPAGAKKKRVAELAKLLGDDTPLFTNDAPASLWASCGVARAAAAAGLEPASWAGVAKAATARHAAPRCAALGALRGRRGALVAACAALWDLARAKPAVSVGAVAHGDDDAPTPVHRPNYRDALRGLLALLNEGGAWPGGAVVLAALLASHDAVNDCSPRYAALLLRRVPRDAPVAPGDGAPLTAALLDGEGAAFTRAGLFARVARQRAAAAAAAALAPRPGGAALVRAACHGPLLAELEALPALAPTADELNAYLGRVAREADAPSLFADGARKDATKGKAADVKTGRRPKLYGADDEQWAEQVKREIAAKKGGGGAADARDDARVRDAVAAAADKVARKRRRVLGALAACAALADAAPATCAGPWLAAAAAACVRARDAFAACVDGRALDDTLARLAAAGLGLEGLDAACVGAAAALAARGAAAAAVLAPPGSTDRSLVARALALLRGCPHGGVPFALPLARGALCAAPDVFGDPPCDGYEPPSRDGFGAALSVVASLAEADDDVLAAHRREAFDAVAALQHACCLDDLLRITCGDGDASPAAAAFTLAVAGPPPSLGDLAPLVGGDGARPLARGALGPDPRQRVDALKAAEQALRSRKVDGGDRGDDAPLRCRLLVARHFEDAATREAAEACWAQLPSGELPDPVTLRAFALEDAGAGSAEADYAAGRLAACAALAFVAASAGAGAVVDALRSAFDAAKPDDGAAPAGADDAYFAAPGDEGPAMRQRDFELKVAADLRARRRAAVALAALFASGAVVAAAPGSTFAWLVDSGLPDDDDVVRGELVNAGVAFLDGAAGAGGVAAPLAVLERALAAPLDAETQEAVVALLGAAAKHLDVEDARLPDVAERLADALVAPRASEAAAPAAPAPEKKKKAAAPRPVAKTGAAAIMGGGGSTLKRPGGGAKRGPAQPLLGAASLRPKPKAAPGRAAAPSVKKTVKKKNREAGQVAIADGLVPLVKAMKKPHGDRAGALLERLLAACLESPGGGERRGAAHGVAAAIKGLGIGSLKAHGVVAKLEAALDAGEGINAKHGALSAVERLAARLGVLFEPYEIALLPFLLRAFSEGSDVVRDAAKGAARKVFEGLSAHGVKLAFPAVLGAASGDETSNWRARVAAIDMLGATAHCAPKQLGAVLPRAVPALAGALADTSAQVRDAAKAALDDVASVARNPEVKALKRELIEALVDPAHATREALDALLGREFAHALDAPSLALLAPILQRGLRDRAAETKRRAALVAGNLSALCSGTAQATAALAPHMPALQPLLEAAAVGDAHPDVRSAAARALAQIVGALGEVQVPFVVERLVNAALGCRSSDATVDGGDILGGDAGGGANGGLLGGAASGASERSGAAQALSLVLNELGEDRVATCLTQSLAPLGRQETAAGREGALWCVRYLARDTAEFSPLVGDALGCVLDGLADDADPVREVALLAGKQLVRSHGREELRVLLPSLEARLLGTAWRIRAAAAQLIGELLCLVGDAKPVGVAVEELDDIDAAMGDEATGALIEEQIGAAGWRNTLSSLYIARLDAVAAVRQAAVEVWKTVVPNTPRALRDILPVLVARLVAMLTPAGADGGAPRGPAAPRPPADASSDDDDSGDEDLDEGDDADAEKQRVASRALGDVVKKIGDRVVPELVPLLRESFAEGDEATRVGVCLGLAEVASATPQRQALGHLGLLAPVIEDALCGSSRSTPRVQAHAALAFHALYGQAGRDAVDAMLPGLLRRLDDDDDDGDGSPAVRARQALRDVLRRRSRELLPLVVPALLKRPIGDLRCAALSAVADVAGGPLSPFVSSVARGVLAELAAIPPGDGGEDDARRGALLAAAADVAAAVAAAGFASDAVGQLASPFATTKDDARRDAAAVAAAFFAAVKRRLAAPPPGSLVAPDASSRLLDAAPKLLKELLCCLGDGDGGVRSAAVDGLEAYGAAFDAEQQATHLDFTRVTLASAASDARWKQKRGDDPLPALSEDPRCLKALLPSYLRALLQGSPEARESAALGLGELVDLSSEAALKPLAIKVAGPLIRVVGDRFAAPVKAAILGALSALLRRGPLLVKAFVPQLQATFSKALRDPSRDVRARATAALGLLAPLSTRLDALVADLAQSAGADDAPEVVVAALLGALVVVFANLGAKAPKPESVDAARSAARDFAGHADPEVAAAAEKLGAALA